jgi:hypothetical protein
VIRLHSVSASMHHHMGSDNHAAIVCHEIINEVPD